MVTPPTLIITINLQQPSNVTGNHISCLSYHHIIITYRFPSTSPSFSASLSLAPFSFSAMILLPTLQIKLTVGKELLRCSSHCQHTHIVPSHLLSQMNYSWLYCVLLSSLSPMITSWILPSFQHHELSTKQFLFWKETLPWPYFSSSFFPIFSLSLTANCSKKSCLYLEYPIYTLPCSFKSTLIRISYPPLHQNFSLKSPLIFTLLKSMANS